MKQLNQNICDLCRGTGKIEKFIYHTEEGHGFHIMEEPTGEFIECPQCGDDGSDDAYQQAKDNLL